MMALRYLEVRQLRNLTHVEITPSSQLNVLAGSNASGKTSLLEAVHLIGLGRSFRTSHNRRLVQDGSDEALLFARIFSAGREVPVGIRKGISQPTEVRIAGENAQGAAQLAELLPLIVITPEVHGLLHGEPRERRSLLDWGLFHVEQQYLFLWQRYRRLLEQRNAALRQSTPAEQMVHWEHPLAEAGERISRSREQYLRAIEPGFAAGFAALLDEPAPALVYRRGWKQGVSLGDALASGRERDQQLGYTMPGPHRADIRLMADDGGDTLGRMSRGQQKLAVCALRIAQAQHMNDQVQKLCTILLDDLPAELDGTRRTRLLSLLQRGQGQCFITTTDPDLLDVSTWTESRMFHVERGEVREMV